MKDHDPPIPKDGVVPVPPAEVQSRRGRAWSMATRDHAVIRAPLHRVADHPGNVGMGNPGLGRFRPISWTEWLDHFDRNRLTFVYQEETADRAFALWQSRGSEHGHDRQDWFDSEQQLRQSADGRTGRYWFVQRDADEKKQMLHPAANPPRR